MGSVTIKEGYKIGTGKQRAVAKHLQRQVHLAMI